LLEKEDSQYRKRKTLYTRPIAKDICINVVVH